MKTLYIILGILIVIVIIAYAYLNALGNMWSLHTPDNSPYFITTEPITIKNIAVPIGTKISYKERFFWQKRKQKKLINEKYMTTLSLKEGTLNWGGVPITMIHKFYNEQMTGYTVYADFSKLDKADETPFSTLWQSCDDRLGITVKDISDWSFNRKNILDINSCSVLFQRYFKEDKKQQDFLDKLFAELQKTEINN